MSNSGSSYGTTQDFIPAVPPTQIGKYAGLAMHFPTLADLNAAVVKERSNIGIGSPMWAEGQSATVGTETASRTRRLWSASAQHFRTVVINGAITLTLAADGNAVLAASGIPASGTGAEGDVSIDQAAATAYRKGSGTWASAITWGGNFSGGTLTTALVLAGDATAPLNAVTLQQLQSALIGVGKRSRARVMSRTNVTITTALVPGQVIDGVTLVAGDIVLLTGQTAAAQNGPYVCGATPARSTEFDTWAEFPGSIIGVYEGTTNGDTLWFCTVNDGGTLGTTAISFIAFSLTPIVNDVTTGGTASALSAEMGKQLQLLKAPKDSPAFTGPMSQAGPSVLVPHTMGAAVAGVIPIDITAAKNVGTYNANCKFGLSATPTSNVLLPVQVTNGSATVAIVATLPDAWSGLQNAMITPSFTIPPSGTLSIVLEYDGSKLLIFGDSGSSLVVTDFATNGTFPVDPNAKAIRVMGWGPGGPGGGGARVAPGTAASGGAAGGSGGVFDRTFAPSELTSTVAVTIGAAPAGGAGATTAGSGGSTGAVGTPTSFGAYASARAGGQGSGGFASATAAGSGAGAGLSLDGGAGSASTGGVGMQGGAIGVTTTVGAAATNTCAGASGGGAPPGAAGMAGGDGRNAMQSAAAGAGGGVSTTPAAFPGGAGGRYLDLAIVTGAAIGVAGGNSPAPIGSNGCPGAAGGGGSVTGAGGAGGDGHRGAGGGGGGASSAGVGGDGGDGGEGFLRAYTYY